MTRARWIIASSWLLLLWLIAGVVWAPAVQRNLQKAAEKRLSKLETGYEAVRIQFSGQTAVVTGQVRFEQTRNEIGTTLAHRLIPVGLFHSGLNPVTQVHNETEVVPYPPGWLMLAVQGSRAILRGVSSSDQEARDITRLLQDRWAEKLGRITGNMKSDGIRFDEAPAFQLTLDGLPLPHHEEGGDAAQVFLARPGAGWENVTLATKDDLLRQQFSNYPITEVEWRSIILPSLAQTRRFQEAEQARIAEAEAQAKLPPPHVFFAARDQRLLLRGELATLKIKRELLNAVIGSFPDWRVIDDLRVNDQRRTISEFGPVTTALLPQLQEPEDDKSLALGLSGSAWQFVDWKLDEEELPWKKMLPPDLPIALVQDDIRMVSQWLQGSAQGIPSLPIPAQPSFLTLTLLPGKVILAGQLAEEGLRTRLIEAARRAYAGDAVIFSEALLARGTCEPTAEIEQTVRSLPPLPKEGEAPVIAFARPGQVWKSRTATQDLIIPGALAKSGLTPPGFPAAMAEDTFAAEAYDHLRHHWQPIAAPAQENPTR